MRVWKRKPTLSAVASPNELMASAAQEENVSASEALPGGPGENLKGQEQKAGRLTQSAKGAAGGVRHSDRASYVGRHWRRLSGRWRQWVTHLAHRLLDHALNILLSPIRFFKTLCFCIGFIFLSVTMALGGALYHYLRDLPRLENLKFREVKALAQAKIQERLSEKKKAFQWVALDEMSREYLYAIVISEDATFFEHRGFNFEAMANSLAENIKEQRFAYGGSTISQQVAKNLFLSQEKTLARKIREFFVTRSLEANFSKNEILEMYLNLAEFGPDIVGVNRAAWEFFKKGPQRINAAEGAFIALMLPAPKRHYYSIYQNRNLTRVKRKKIERVLRDMLYEEYLSDAQYSQYVKYDYFLERSDRSERSLAGVMKRKPRILDSEDESEVLHGGRTN